MMAAQSADRQATDNGVRTAVDANGNLRQPTIEEHRALDAATAARPSIMRVVTLSSTGGASASVDESNDHTLVARTDMDGNIVLICTDDSHAAATFAASTAPIDTILRLKPAQRRAERE
jgi:hypothetical protein